MCGRIGLAVPWEELFEYFNLIRPTSLDPEMPPRYNIAPSQPIMVIRTGDDGGREGMLARWGLVPSWVKDPKEFTLLVNARSETAAEKPSFRSAMRHRRILVPASGFYEWKRFGKGKKSQPYWVRPKDGNIVAFGGLMETWCGADGSEVDTACILTTAANPTFEAIHHRLPLVILKEDFDRWMDCKSQEPRDIVDLLVPANDEFFECIPISDAVNKVANSGPEIQNPVDLETRDADETGPAEEPADKQLSMF